MSNAPRPIPVFERFPHTVLVRRAKENADGYDTVIAALECRIYRTQEIVREGGFAKIIQGPQKMICDWEDACGSLPNETTSVRQLDELVHTTDAGTEVFVVKSTENVANLNYNLECELELRQPHA